MSSTSRGSHEWDKIGPWRRMHRLGKGGFGTVYLGKRESDEKVFAVKSTYFVPQGHSKNPIEDAKQKIIENNALSSLINEIRTLKKLKSPYIIRYLGCGTSNGPPEMDGRLLLDCYLEYLPRGSLGHLLNGPLGEPFIKAYTKDILRALLYLHFNKLVHGDLKCLNVLMGSNNCKLADFGSVKDVRTSFFSKILFGTKGYRAPEVESYTEQTYASDIFSLGCTVQEMATGERPEQLKWPKARPKVGRTAKTPSNPKQDQMSDNLMNFLSKCLAQVPDARWSASDLLKHPFITEPSSPGWSPYDIPLPHIMKAHQGPIVPPNDLESGLPTAPFSPIHVVPMKRRRLSLSCMNTAHDSDVVVHHGPSRRLPKDPPAYQIAASDKPSLKPKFFYPGPDKKTAGSGNVRVPTLAKKRQPPGGQSRAAQAAIKRLSTAPRVVLAKMNRTQKSEVGSTICQGFKVEVPTGVAQLQGGDTDEDKSPLVVKICSEFDIPLPPEYQKWVVDPDYDPNGPPPRKHDGGINTIRNIMKRALVRLLPRN